MVGFTLVEILVVLVIVGLLAGIALPRLQRQLQSMEYSAQRKAILTQLDGLGHRAFSEGRSMRLTSLPDVSAAEPAAAPLQLPTGWKLIVASPIQYAFNGLCSGGKVTLHSPDEVSFEFELKPPSCRPEAGN